MTTLFTYDASVGFVTGIPARDITDEDSAEIQAVALANSKTSNPCFFAVAAPSAQTRTVKAKAETAEDKGATSA